MLRKALGIASAVILIMTAANLVCDRAHAAGLSLSNFLQDAGLLIFGNLQDARVGITTTPNLCINWTGASFCAAGTTVQFNVSGISPIYSQSPSNQDRIKDITALGPSSQFLTVMGDGFLAGNIINFDLVSIPTSPVNVGNCTSNAPLNACTLANSPFTMIEDHTGTQVTIAFDALMNGYIGPSASDFTAYKARFSLDLSGTVGGFGACNGVVANIVNLVACLGSGGTIDATWSATASPGTPATPASTPPTVTCSASPNSLWPADGNAVAVTVSGLVTPGTKALAPGGTTYAVTDEYGQIQPSGGFTAEAGGAYAFVIPLIAARDGNDQDGRHYTISVQAADALGSVGSCTTVVTVPHDQGH